MTDRLRECPFCGGEARITKLPKSVKPKAYHIGCSQCGTVKILFMTEEEAIENWNTRKPMDRIVEQLEERTAFLKDCTKYGNKDAEQQNHSYSTMLMYEVADMVDDLIEIVKGEV